MKTDWDEMIFENRNHLYGAYILRKSYHRHMTYAMCICIGLLLLCLVLLHIIQLRLASSSLPEIAEREVWIENIPLLPPPKFTTYTTPVAKIKTLKSDFYKVVEDHKLPKEKKTTPIKETTKKTQKTDTEDGLIHMGESPILVDTLHRETGSPDGSTTTQGDELTALQGDAMPVFGDGPRDLQNYLKANLHYPSEAYKNKTKGKVLVSFTVNKNGKIEDVKVIQPLENGCSEEAVRVIQKMPNWKPGRFKGRAVAVTFMLPVEFNMR